MDYRKKFRVDPHAKLKLSKLDPAYTGKHESEDAAKEETEHYLKKLTHQQALLYAEHKHSILDRVAGDGRRRQGRHGQARVRRRSTRKACVSPASSSRPPRSSRMTSSGASIANAPGRGQIAIFNRSHYEGVLVERVHKLVDKATWTARYQHIRDFEALLAENKTTILKFFLHISKEEQLARFAQRLDDPTRNWKISEADYSEREVWDDYIEAFEDCDSRNQHAGRALVRDPCESQVVSQSRGVANHRRHDGGVRNSPSRRRRLTSRTSGANIMPPSGKRRTAGRRLDSSRQQRFP